jgi:bacterioferritin
MTYPREMPAPDRLETNTTLTRRSSVVWNEKADTRRPDTMATRTSAQGILSPDRAEKRDEIIELLKTAYWMELETVMSYIANSVNPDGVRAQEIRESLAEDIQEELGHAQQFADRIKELYGVVPGSLEFSAEQSFLQPPDEQTDVVHVIRGVVEAETGAIEHYNKIIEACDGVDWVTQDMVIDILHDEEGHRRLFEGFLREYEAEGLA